MLKCRPNTADEWCRRCGGHGDIRDTVLRRLAHEPFGHRPTTLHIRLRRYKCIECGHVWRQDTTTAAPARAKISRAGLDWALRALVVDHDTVSVIADKLAVSWHTANSAVLAEGHRLLINDPNRFDDVSVIGVDEHVWRHTRRGDKYVTVIIDLTPISQGTGPARLLDMVSGRSKQVFKQWLAARPKGWRDGIEIVAMDGFSGFKTAAAEELPDAVEVMDQFHVVKLAGDAPDGLASPAWQTLTPYTNAEVEDLNTVTDETAEPLDDAVVANAEQTAIRAAAMTRYETFLDFHRLPASHTIGVLLDFLVACHVLNTDGADTISLSPYAPLPAEVLPLAAGEVEREDQLRWDHMHGLIANKIREHLMTEHEPGSSPVSLLRLGAQLDTDPEDIRHTLEIMRNDEEISTTTDTGTAPIDSLFTLIF